MQINKKTHKRKIEIITKFAFIICIFCSILLIFFLAQPVHSPFNKTVTNNTETKITQNSTAKKVNDPPQFNKALYSTTNPESVWVVVNKQHPFSIIDFTPNDLINSNGATISAKAKNDFESMFSTALSQGVNLVVGSSFRSFTTQSSLYNNYVAVNGQAVADTFSAKPGYSEHQTGLAIDFIGNTNSNCNYDDCFADTPEGSWLNSHAYEFGFLLRYTTENQSITGYKNEPWHYRYIGKELSSEMKKQNIKTLEEFFSITGGTFY